MTTTNFKGDLPFDQSIRCATLVVFFLSLIVWRIAAMPRGSESGQDGFQQISDCAKLAGRTNQGDLVAKKCASCSSWSEWPLGESGSTCAIAYRICSCSPRNTSLVCSRGTSFVGHGRSYSSRCRLEESERQQLMDDKLYKQIMRPSGCRKTASQDSQSQRRWWNLQNQSDLSEQFFDRHETTGNTSNRGPRFWNWPERVTSRTVGLRELKLSHTAWFTLNEPVG